MLNGVLDGHEAGQPQYRVQLSLRIVEVGLRFQALHLDAIDVVENGCLDDVVDCSQVYFHALVHG